MKIRYNIDDLHRCFDFSVKYHLAENKSNYNRTTGQYRGLGSILNDFFYGKLVEIGVVKAIEKYNHSIECVLDFEIHPLNKTNISDPDIPFVIDSHGRRNPNLFVEIKYHSETDRWLGLTYEQFVTIKSNKQYKDFYFIYASLYCEDELNEDLLGVYLRTLINHEYLTKFAKLESLYLKIDRILPSSLLEGYGVEFKAGRFLLETEIFQEIQEKFAKYYINNGHKLNYTKGILPVIMTSKQDPVKEYGEFLIDGDFDLWIKENEASNRYLIQTFSKTIISSPVLGQFHLEPGKFYLICFNTVGRDPVLKRNNIWIADRNIKHIQTESVEAQLQRIAESI